MREWTEAADRKDDKREGRERCKVMWNVRESRERIQKRQTGGRKREEEIQGKGVSRLRGKTVAGAH